MKGRGQGSLEYLLIIGAALIIAIIVIAVVTGLGSNNAPPTSDVQAQADVGKCLNNCCEFGINSDKNCETINPAACQLPDNNSNWKGC
ncbi:MAG: class III signal peptide-containing protein [Candidatus Izemoplasmatales bacterium]|jgi:hypothetical protein